MLRYCPNKKRVWVLGKRIHHGLVGVALIGVGVALAIHDRKDFPFLKDNE